LKRGRFAGGLKETRFEKVTAMNPQVMEYEYEKDSFNYFGCAIGRFHQPGKRYQHTDVEL
jgi:hypothetical protein